MRQSTPSEQTEGLESWYARETNTHGIYAVMGLIEAVTERVGHCKREVDSRPLQLIRSVAIQLRCCAGNTADRSSESSDFGGHMP